MTKNNGYGNDEDLAKRIVKDGAVLLSFQSPIEMPPRRNNNWQAQNDVEISTLEQQNNAQTESLLAKVSAIRLATLDVQNEARAQMNLLNSMEQGFGNTGGMLDTTLQRVRVMTQTRNGKRFCWWTLGIVLMFVILWLMLRNRKTTTEI